MIQKFSVCLVTFWLGFSGCVCAASVTSGTLWEHSEYWPFRVTVTEAVATANTQSVLRVGAVGVLIRVEQGNGSPVLVLDFGRQGIHELPALATDVVEAANRVRLGALRKFEPNYIEMLSTRLISVQGDSAYKQPLEEVRKASAFAFIYYDTPEVLQGIAAALQERSAGCSKFERVHWVCMPTYKYKDRELSTQLVELGLPFKFFHDFLAAPYRASLHHGYSGGPMIVVTDLEGKILSVSPSYDLGAVLEVVERSECPAEMLED